ncbi:MAG: hypothetical protein RLZZ480_929 [Candidatus Parcubacteria bacterium]|jgi:hypothetical protein
MSSSEEKFYQYLGELWRLVLVIENFMRISIMIEDGKEYLFPNRLPYMKNDVYEQFPKSYKMGFDKLVSNFKEDFPDIDIPDWFSELRHALAHGMVGQINHSPEQQLVKFNTRDGKLTVEYAEELKTTELLTKVKILDSLRSKLINHIKVLQLAKKQSGG